MLHTELVAVDAVLSANARALGTDFTGYRNHSYRVANFCLALTVDAAGPESAEKIAVAAAFHDLGIWTDSTFDYLPPSVRIAKAHLAKSGKSEWAPDITEMILQHHKLTAFRGDRSALVEPFRRADLVDVTRGFAAFGLPRRFLLEVFSEWPDAGFHKRLGSLFLRRLRSHPWNPLPMVKL